MTNLYLCTATLLIAVLGSITTTAEAQARFTSWSACSRTCGQGVSKRRRLCPTVFSCAFIVRRTETRTCMMKTCQAACGQWTQCSATCGYGTRTQLSCLTGQTEQATCFTPCTVEKKNVRSGECENSMLSTYRHPNSTCCSSSNAQNGECGVSSAVPPAGAALTDKSAQKLWPWTVIVKVGTDACLGAILSSNFVITSAKCVFRQRVSSIKVIAGPRGSHYFDRELKFDYDVQYRAAKRIVVHPQFNYLNYIDANVALIELKSELSFASDYVAPICLPQGEVVPTGSTCVSFDLTTSRSVAPVDFRVLNFDECINKIGKYHVGTKKASSQMREERVGCTGQLPGSRFSCKGTSGAALMCQRCSSCSWMLYGVTSFGDVRCALRMRPGLFAKASYFEPWILQQMGAKASGAAAFASCQS